MPSAEALEASLTHRSPGGIQGRPSPPKRFLGHPGGPFFGEWAEIPSEGENRTIEEQNRMSDDPVYGWQPDRSYVPSPNEIEEQTAKLRSTWSSEELRRRSAWAWSERWTTPEVAVESPQSGES